MSKNLKIQTIKITQVPVSEIKGHPIDYNCNNSIQTLLADLKKLFLHHEHLSYVLAGLKIIKQFYTKISQNFSQL